jgi:glutamate-1-semialdehyde 2,1-aminomutase
MNPMPSLSHTLPGEAPSPDEGAWLAERGVYEGISRNLAWWERANASIVSGGQRHKRPVKYMLRGGPAFTARAKGARFWDVDGREYIDYLLSYGPIILGHADDEINAAVREQLELGSVFTVESTLAVELAEELRRLIPCAELVTYCIGGSSADVAAIRYARVHTRREKVLRCGYHGWFDWCFPNDPGAPHFYRELITAIPFNNLAALEAALEANRDQVAAVIIETLPEAIPEPGYFAGVRALCDRYGSVFILDEVKTGFRFALGGAQQYYGIDPDLAVFGKAMGNGFPVSAVVGRRRILEGCGDTFIGATFHGDNISLAAATATIRALKARDGIAHIWSMGRRLMDGMNAVLQRWDLPLRVVGQPPMPAPMETAADDPQRPMPANWKGKVFGAFFGALQRRGVYMTGHCWFVSVSHGRAEIDATLAAAESAAEEARQLLERFEGPPGGGATLP